jgi:hypothetical protein
MSAAGKIFQHVAGVAGRVRFAEDAAFESYNCVGGEDDGGADGASGGEFGFGVGEALDELAGGFTGNGSFVNSGSDDGEGESGVVENFGSARGCGSENQFHVFGNRHCKVLCAVKNPTLQEQFPHAVVSNCP